MFESVDEIHLNETSFSSHSIILLIYILRIDIFL